jgi:hypothetical protein
MDIQDTHRRKEGTKGKNGLKDYGVKEIIPLKCQLTFTLVTVQVELCGLCLISGVCQ